MIVSVYKFPSFLLYTFKVSESLFPSISTFIFPDTIGNTREKASNTGISSSDNSTKSEVYKLGRIPGSNSSLDLVQSGIYNSISNSDCLYI